MPIRFRSTVLFSALLVAGTCYAQAVPPASDAPTNDPATGDTSDAPITPAAPQTGVDSVPTIAAPADTGDASAASVPAAAAPADSGEASIVSAPAAAAPSDAGDASTVSTPAAAAAEPSPAPVATSGPVGTPPAGKGQIVFFREKKFQGSFVRYKVREGNNELGKLSSGTYFVHVADPGAHQYVVHSEAKDVLDLEIEEGETYYVVGGTTMGMFVGRPNLSPSDAATFEAMAGDLKRAE